MSLTKDQVPDHPGQEYLNRAIEELYTAIQAIENGDLPFARSSSVRATNFIVDAHQKARQAQPIIRDETLSVDPKS
jgi:hypothetical protein